MSGPRVAGEHERQAASTCAGDLVDLVVGARPATSLHWLPHHQCPMPSIGCLTRARPRACRLLWCRDG